SHHRSPRKSPQAPLSLFFDADLAILAGETVGHYMRVISLAAAVMLAGCSPQAAKLAGALVDEAPAVERAAPAMQVAVALSGPMPDDQAPPVTPAAGQCKSRPIAEYATRMVGADKADIANWPGFAAISIVSPDGKDSQFFCGGILADASTVIT